LNSITAAYSQKNNLTSKAFTMIPITFLNRFFANDYVTKKLVPFDINVLYDFSTYALSSLDIASSVTILTGQLPFALPDHKLYYKLQLHGMVFL
jgi:hypothetical protein